MKPLSHLLFFALLLSSNIACAQTVDVETFEKKLNNDVQLLDVRTPEEYQQGHLQNAMLADWNDKQEFNRRIEAMDKNKTVYIYCLSGGRSSAAKQALEQKGFVDIVELKGGITAWRQAEKPEESLAKVEQMSEASYLAMLSSAEVVLVDFGASWCPPCRRMEPIMEEMEKDLFPKIPLIKIDASSQSSLLKAHNVKEMPTYIIYKDGQEIWRNSGMMKKEAFRAAFDQLGIKY